MPEEGVSTGPFSEGITHVAHTRCIRQLFVHSFGTSGVRNTRPETAEMTFCRRIFRLSARTAGRTLSRGDVASGLPVFPRGPRRK